MTFLVCFGSDQLITKKYLNICPSRFAVLIFFLLTSCRVRFNGTLWFRLLTAWWIACCRKNRSDASPKISYFKNTFYDKLRNVFEALEGNSFEIFIHEWAMQSFYHCEFFSPFLVPTKRSLTHHVERLFIRNTFKDSWHMEKWHRMKHASRASRVTRCDFLFHPWQAFGLSQIPGHNSTTSLCYLVYKF